MAFDYSTTRSSIDWVLVCLLGFAIIRRFGLRFGDYLKIWSSNLWLSEDLVFDFVIIRRFGFRFCDYPKIWSSIIGVCGETSCCAHADVVGWKELWGLYDTTFQARSAPSAQQIVDVLCWLTLYIFWMKINYLKYK